MKPVMVTLAGHAIYYYGFFFALGILAATLVASSEFKRKGLPADWGYDLVLGVTVQGFLAAKLFFVATQVAQGRGTSDWHLLDGQGMSIAGSILAFPLFCAVYARWRRITWPFVLDVAMLGGCLGHALGRLGCFMSGCCYGRPSDLPWAVTFSDPLSAAPRGIPLHPTQLYDALASFTLFAVLMALRHRKRFEGQFIVIALAYYGFTRAVLETFRGDKLRGVYYGGLITSSQIVCVVIVVLSLVLYRRFRSVEPRRT